MLHLKSIVKNYVIGDMTVEALKDVDIQFRKNEFVSILGPSGCGKTTMLNIIGGLDRYTNGDLIIGGRTTKKFKDRDWDAYRNRSVGFVFQSYNLIPHQTVLSNVELALTLSGVSKAERRKRATDVLIKVGLGDQLKKKPNQISGGQMQRVAIARALVNDPEIMLADEPTGALDTETSTQIMALLKEIAKDRLVIMVTHNPELANEYSTRIIKLLDGRVTGDSNPYNASSDALESTEAKQGKNKKEKRAKTQMSFRTALSLSLNNLMTKKTRTMLTAFAGSIGIIGIALILSLQSGVQAYITSVEKDTLSTYPLIIEDTSVDMSSMMQTMMSNSREDDVERSKDQVYSRDIMMDMIQTMTQQVKKNNLTEFKRFIESAESGVKNYTNDIQYSYDLDFQIYKQNTDGLIQVNPSSFLNNLGAGEMMSGMMGGMMSGISSIWSEMLGEQDILDSQYELLEGNWPNEYNEVVLVVNKNNEISDLALYSLGIKNQQEFYDIMTELRFDPTAIIPKFEQAVYSYEDLLNTGFKLIINTDYYEKTDSGWDDKSDNPIYMQSLADKAIDIRISGIVRPSADANAESIAGTVGYTSALTHHVIERINSSEIVKTQLDNPEINVFTGKPFDDAAADAFDMNSLTPEEQMYLASLPEEEAAALMANKQGESATYDDNLQKLGYVNTDKPSSISIYPKDFSSKEKITEIISDYNKRQMDQGYEENVITYTDYVELLMSSVTTIIDAISYVLIAFVAISLVVSSIMIGIITYISVLERTKEIGILRSIGAAKKDISRVFNAETMIVGLVAGSLGILITFLLTFPINAIINHVSGVMGLAKLPVAGALILVALSILLTLIAGLIPSRVAAKKDPVVALRTE